MGGFGGAADSTFRECKVQCLCLVLFALRFFALQTKAIGVILPPPDIRAIVDKTAQFVAKNGA